MLLSHSFRTTRNAIALLNNLPVEEFLLCSSLHYLFRSFFFLSVAQATEACLSPRKKKIATASPCTRRIYFGALIFLVYKSVCFVREFFFSSSSSSFHVLDLSIVFVSSRTQGVFLSFIPLERKGDLEESERLRWLNGIGFPRLRFGRQNWELRSMTTCNFE